MSSLTNPMRFSLNDRTVDVKNYLRHPDFDNKYVTDIEIRPSSGNIYIHWEPATDDSSHDGGVNE